MAGKSKAPAHTVRPEDEKAALLNRLHRIEGQVRGVARMIENDAYCDDVLTQAAAAASAMDAFNREVLRQHVRTCVARDLRTGRDEVTDELIATISRLMR